MRVHSHDEDAKGRIGRERDGGSACGPRAGPPILNREHVAFAMRRNKDGRSGLQYLVGVFRGWAR